MRDWEKNETDVERTERERSEVGMPMHQKLTNRHIYNAVKEGRVPEHLPTANERMKAFIDGLNKWCDESGLSRPDMRSAERRALDEARAARRAAAPPAPVRGPSFWPGKTMKMCHDEGCKVESHYRSGKFPVRAVRNRNGNWALWVPQEVLPSVAARMGIRYNRPVYRGSAGSFVPSSHHHQWRHGSAKWDWSVVRDGA